MSLVEVIKGAAGDTSLMVKLHEYKLKLRDVIAYELKKQRHEIDIISGDINYCIKDVKDSTDYVDGSSKVSPYTLNNFREKFLRQYLGLPLPIQARLNDLGLQTIMPFTAIAFMGYLSRLQSIASQPNEEETLIHIFDTADSLTSELNFIISMCEDDKYAPLNNYILMLADEYNIKKW